MKPRETDNWNICITQMIGKVEAIHIILETGNPNLLPLRNQTQDPKENDHLERWIGINKRILYQRRN